MRTRLFTIVLMLLVASTYAQDFEIEINGNIEFNNLLSGVTEAGLNLSTSIESTSDVLLSIHDRDALGKKTNPKKKWSLSIRKEGVDSGEATLLVVRTGKGTRIGSNGSPNIHGGNVYQVINNTNNYFFRGMGEIKDIPLRFKVEGLSVLSGSGNHQLDISITVSDGWK